MSDRPAPYTGITVVDLTQVLAGPYCTYQLALLGADVIKVEPPGGEFTRNLGGIPDLSAELLGVSFCVQNADKQCLEVDLKDPAGRDTVLSIVDRADVFVENFRPGVAERLGFGHQALMERTPDLVYCSLSAYGATGPLGGRPAYDHVVQAMSGIMELTGPEGSEPTKVGAPYVDFATGLIGAFAISAALRERDRTGEGQLVDVSMLDAAMHMMSSSVTHVATTGQDLPKLGNDPASRAPAAGCFRAGDGRWVQFVANTDRQFLHLCDALGRPRWKDDDRFSSASGRRDHRTTLRTAIENTIAEDSAETWEASLVEHGIPVSVVRSISDVLETGHPAHRQMLHDLEVGGASHVVRVPGVPFLLNGEGIGPRAAPRGLGADNGRWFEGGQHGAG